MENPRSRQRRTRGFPSPKSQNLRPRSNRAWPRPAIMVTLKVTVKLDPGWHIFQYSKEYDGEGPTPTSFDAFDLQGLVSKGSWGFFRPNPFARKTLTFPTLEHVEYFEEEASWTLPLQVPTQYRARIEGPPGPGRLSDLFEPAMSSARPLDASRNDTDDRGGRKLPRHRRRLLGKPAESPPQTKGEQPAPLKADPPTVKAETGPSRQRDRADGPGRLDPISCWLAPGVDCWPWRCLASGR